MEEARRHLADLEPEGAVEALLAVTAFAESRFDDGNTATLLASTCHKLRGLVALRCLARVNPNDRDAFSLYGANGVWHAPNRQPDKISSVPCVQEAEGDKARHFPLEGRLARARARTRAHARLRQVEVGAACGAEDCCALTSSGGERDD